MARFGIFLLIMGIGSFILPIFGLQFSLLAMFGNAQPIAALAMAVVGGVMLFLHTRANN